MSAPRAAIGNCARSGRSRTSTARMVTTETREYIYVRAPVAKLANGRPIAIRRAEERRRA
jgi:hypothetical protein